MSLVLTWIRQKIGVMTHSEDRMDNETFLGNEL